MTTQFQDQMNKAHEAMAAALAEGRTTEGMNRFGIAEDRVTRAVVMAGTEAELAYARGVLDGIRTARLQAV